MAIKEISGSVRKALTCEAIVPLYLLGYLAVAKDVFHSHIKFTHVVIAESIFVPACSL